MKLAFCAVAACVLGCGKGSQSGAAGSGSGSAAAATPAADAASWKLGGLDVPFTFIPKTLGVMPTVLPLKPGAPLRPVDMPDDPPNVDHKLMAGYGTGEKPNDSVVTGYDHLAKVDLLPDLTKGWGAPGAEEKTPSGTSACWPETNKIKTCWVRYGEQPNWHLVFTATDLPAAAPAPAEPPKPAQTFKDAPLGKGTCALLGIKEASEIVGQQLAYGEKGDPLCTLEGEGTFHVAVTKLDAAQSWPEQWKVDGFADKAGWDMSDGLVFMVGGKNYRVGLLDLGRTSEQVRAINLELAKKVLARIQKK